MHKKYVTPCCYKYKRITLNIVNIIAIALTPPSCQQKQKTIHTKDQKHHNHPDVWQKNKIVPILNQGIAKLLYINVHTISINSEQTEK